jgi:hypothetical protein
MKENTLSRNFIRRRIQQNEETAFAQITGRKSGRKRKSFSKKFRALHIKPGKGELPALVKAGCREAAGRFVQEINLLTNTTPALRATPPRLRRGVLSTILQSPPGEVRTSDFQV